MFEYHGKPYEVTHNGQIVNEGDEFSDSKESFKVIGLDRGPEHNGTAKVLVEITANPTMPGRVGWRHSFYDHSLGLRVERRYTMDEAMEALSDWQEPHVRAVIDSLIETGLTTEDYLTPAELGVIVDQLVQDRDAIAGWLLNYVLPTEANRYRIVCIMSQSEWKNMDARIEATKGSRALDSKQARRAVGFVLSGLWECHGNPHLPTCPDN